MRTPIAVFAPLAVLVALAGCEQAKPVYVDGAYVTLNPNPDNPAAAYFTIHGGAQPVVLRAIETDAAVRLEMHESMMEGGMSQMKPLETVDVPAGGTIKFEPMGKHVMLWQINPQAVAAGKITFNFIFSNGDRILVDATILGADGKPTGSGPAPSANN